MLLYSVAHSSTIRATRRLSVKKNKLEKKNSVKEFHLLDTLFSEMCGEDVALCGKSGEGVITKNIFDPRNPKGCCQACVNCFYKEYNTPTMRELR